MPQGLLMTWLLGIFTARDANLFVPYMASVFFIAGDAI